MKQLLTKQQAVQLLQSFGCSNVSTPVQIKHGTDVWELPNYTIVKYNGNAKPGWKPRFAIYKNGYIRVLQSHSSKHVYQINPRYNTKHRVINKYLLPVDSNIKACAMIYGEDARYTYLIKYIVKNYKKYINL